MSSCNMNNVSVFLVLCALGSSAAFFMRLRTEVKREHQPKENGKPLFLTPYIESGRLAEGRKAAEVPPLLGAIRSYAGFLTVNKEHNSNLFFWFIPAEESPETAPVALWLQGGPGAPSEYGLFAEIGPFEVPSAEGQLKRRTHHWTKKLNYIFLDQPVGTGFSFTDEDAGYVNNMTEVGRDVYNALLQFFKLFPAFAKNEFIITGESYGGKYIPAVAYTIHKSNPTAKQKINLKGVAIGNGWIDPYNMIDYANLLWYLGFIDQKTRVLFANIEKNIKSLIKQKKYVEGFWVLDGYLQANLINGTYFYNTTGLGWYYNFINGQYAPLDDHMIAFLNKSETRRSLHVGNIPYFSLTNQKVQMHLLEDDLQSITPWLEELMDHYKVLLYNGQLDIICAYPLTMNFVNKLKWTGASEYAKADRKKWYVDGDLAGYWKTAGNFTELLVRNAGHMVPTDQPIWALDMIMNFAFDRPFRIKPN